jgi:hypothetical protein
MFKNLQFLSLVLYFLMHVCPYAFSNDVDTTRKKTQVLKQKNVPLTNSINNDYIIHVRKSAGIKLDGNIEEKDWKKAEIVNLSHMVLPNDTGRSVAKSDVMITYDEKAFYLAFIFHDTIPGKRPVESLRRDFVFTNNDNFMIYIDPFNDQTTGYSFGINAAGAQRDGSISDGNVNNTMWDCKWESVTKNFGDRWIGEVRIPFKSLRYKTGVDHWGIQISRNDMKLNEKSAWAPVPRQFPTATLAYAGQMFWETPPPPSRLRLSVIPYIKGSASRNYEKAEDMKQKFDFGSDAKIGLSTSLNLDLTYNPDYSQAEVDDQVTNLDRYELYYPEKRQFFLENSDLFGNYGISTIRPFFSRRIGLDAPVTAGARLSGKIGHDWRLGLMDMQTEAQGDLLARNFFVTTVQKKVFARSNVGMIFVNKQQINTPSDWQGNQYNRVAGLEYNLSSRDNFLNTKFFGQKSFTQGKNASEEYAQGIDLVYSRKSILLEMKESYVGKDFNAETGYVPRTDILRIDPRSTLKYLPKKGKLESIGFLTEVNSLFTPGNMELTDQQINGDFILQFKNRAHLDIKNNLWYVLLQKDYDPSKKGKYFLPAGSSYKWYGFELNFISDNSKLFKYQIHSGYGGYYNGERFFIEGNLNYRVQPYGYLSLVYSYNYLMLPEPWNNSSLWLVGTKLDLTFTDKLFFSTYVQYNQQTDNLNINARFQWRYKPVSDFFIVYTDNYFPEYMVKKNRALVIKLSYWFN